MYLCKGDLHFEKRKGSREQARAYCIKSDGRVEEPFEIGTWEPDAQGTRSDLQQALELFKQGGLKRLATDAPSAFVKYHRGFAALATYTDHPRRRETCRLTIILVGDPGAGKTRWVHESFGQDLYVSPIGAAKGQVWFDGYQGQEVALIDDFTGTIEYGDLLKLTDPWHDQRCPVKGAYVIWKPNIIILTSNEDPGGWYPARREIDALRRRVNIFSYPQDRRRLDDLISGFRQIADTPPSPVLEPTPAPVVTPPLSFDWDEEL